MPASAAVMSFAGSAMGAYSQYANGQYQAQVARNNQILANDNADLAIFTISR